METKDPAKTSRVRAGSGRRTNRVPGEPKCVDKAWNRPAIHFLAQPGDENLDGSRVVFMVTMPDPLAKFGPGKNAARLLHEHLEDIKLTWRERNVFAAPSDVAALHIHLQIGNLKEVRRGRPDPAPSDCVYAGKQFVHRKRLRQVVIGAGLQTLHAISHLAARRQDEDARPTLRLSKPAEDGEAIKPGEIQIEHDEVGRFEKRGLQTFRAIEPRARLMIMPLQRLDDVLGKLSLVFDNQDTHPFFARSIFFDLQ